MALDFSKYKQYDTANGYGNSKQWRKAFGERMGMDEAQEVMRNQSACPHDILGVAPTASQAEIKAAYRVKVKEWHPDTNPDRLEEATEMMKKINAAYTILTNK